MIASTTIPVQDTLDSVAVDPLHHEILFENDQVRVVRWSVARADTTLYHSHPNNLNVCLTDYDGAVTGPNEQKLRVQAAAGSVSWRPAGHHAVANLGRQRMEGIIVEPREPASCRPAGSPDPMIVDPEHHTVEFENDSIRVLREHRQAGPIPVHGHPDNVQILLSDLDAILTTADGNTQTIRGKTGDVRWRPAAQHSGVVRIGKPVEQIVVEMKG